MDAALSAKFGADISDLKNKMGEAKGLISGFTSNLQSIAGTLGLAFGAQQISSMVLDLTKLAGQADGVDQAFRKLEGSSQILTRMQMATKGTVSEFDLMKAAVQANNFNIPIEQMGNLLNFAYERAKATGQSVDYLVNSIVVGIGRKSPLILDNLGISAVQLKEKLHGVSTEAASVGDITRAVGEIATESLNATGKSAETASEKIARIGATWDNIKIKMGGGLADLLADSNNPASLFTNFDNQLTVWASNRVPLWKKILYGSEGYAELAKEIQMWKESLANFVPGAQQGPFQKAALESPTGGPVSASAPAAGRRSLTPVIKQDTKSLEDYAKAQLEAIDADEQRKAEDIIWTETLRNNYEEKKASDEDYTKYLENQTKKRADLLAQQAEQWRQLSIAAGEAIGFGIGSALVGTQSFAQGLKSVAVAVINQLEAMALAAVATGAFLKSIGNPFVAAGLVAAGFALVKGIFSQIGATSSAGGGGVGSAGSGAATLPRNDSLLGANQQTIQVEVVGMISGTNIRLATLRDQQQNQYTRPS